MVSSRNRSAGKPSGTIEATAETLRQIGDAAGVTVWRWDAASDEVRREGFGVETPEAPMSLAKHLEHLHASDRARIRKRLQGALETGRIGNFRFRTRTDDGSVRYCTATHYPVSPQVLQVIAQDVTRTHLAEVALRNSEDHRRHAVALSPEVPWLADPDGNIVEFGPRWLDIVDLDVGDTLGQGWMRALHRDDLQPTMAKWQSSLRSGDPVDLQYRLRLKGGEYRWMRARASARRDERGRILWWYGTLEDIHERVTAEAALRDSEAFSRSILEASEMAIEVLDLDGNLVFMNGPGIRIMEVEDFEAIRGLPFEQFWPADVRSTVLQSITAARQGATVRKTLFGPTAKGTPKWWDLTISPIPGQDGKVTRLLALSNDVTEARRNAEEIEYLARHDNLTGLPNRMHFQSLLKSALDSATGNLAVLSIDLDDFKLVNDTMGHQAGDMLLRGVASRLKLCARNADVVARLGGDEFAILMRLESGDGATTLAQGILASLVRPFSIDGEKVSIGTSIGIAIAPRDGKGAESLMHAADVALYRVKGQKGRDFRYFEPAMDEALRERREMKRDLALALERDEFSLVYQPQVDIVDNRLVGFEALLRWHSQKHGEVPPALFVPLAEESGLMDPIGAFVLERACADATKWPERISLAVNLSPVQFRNRGALRAVARALAKTGLAPQRLELEITETVLFDENVEAVAMLEEFHRMGIRVALDDFGTGYSSLSYLRRFAFDKIKIDRSFISDLPGSEESAAIVRAIIGLARSLRSRVIAEGVETWEQLLALHKDGCHEAQGYLFSHPVPQRRARTLARTGLSGHSRPAPPVRRQA